jgi:hypothetical protein
MEQPANPYTERFTRAVRIIEEMICLKTLIRMHLDDLDLTPELTAFVQEMDVSPQVYDLVINAMYEDEKDVIQPVDILFRNIERYILYGQSVLEEIFPSQS